MDMILCVVSSIPHGVPDGVYSCIVECDLAANIFAVQSTRLLIDVTYKARVS